jgi:hypothetical protein
MLSGRISMLLSGTPAGAHLSSRIKPVFCPVGEQLQEAATGNEAAGLEGHPFSYPGSKTVREAQFFPAQLAFHPVYRGIVDDYGIP